MFSALMSYLCKINSPFLINLKLAKNHKGTENILKLTFTRNEIKQKGLKNLKKFKVESMCHKKHKIHISLMQEKK